MQFVLCICTQALADVAAQTGDADYMKAMRNCLGRCGVSGICISLVELVQQEVMKVFHVDYDLPNEQAYCETCASVGMVFWNQRMNSLTGNAEYIDVFGKKFI